MQQKHGDAIIVIDVFRAFTTACYILARSPALYILADKSQVIAKLASFHSNALLIGKPEKHIHLNYDIPNSPTRTKALDINHKTILHRTQAGAKGILQALKQPSCIVLAAGFVNANATAHYLKQSRITNITILPMGHEATAPSLEDDICADYIQACLKGKKMDLASFLPAIREGAGRYFFTDDQWQYPREDFARCLRVKRFNFAVRATAQEDHAVLTRCDIAFAAKQYPALGQADQ
jgi:2-phosphosulfolactate phosphatase